MSATTELLNWDTKAGLREHDGFVITPYAAIKTSTRRKLEPLTEKSGELLDVWARRGRRGIVVTLTRRHIPLRPGLVLKPKAFGYEFGLDPRVVAWVKEQGPVTARLIAQTPGGKFLFTVVVYKDREVIGYVAPLRWPPIGPQKRRSAKP